MDHRIATRQDLDELWPLVATRLRDEYKFAGIPVGVARGQFLKAIKSERGHVIVNGEGNRLAIMIWQDDARGIATSFAATENFFSPSYVLGFARYMARFQQERGDARIICYSYSVQSEVPKWFKTLRFNLEKTDGVHRVFVREPRGSGHNGRA